MPFILDVKNNITSITKSMAYESEQNIRAQSLKFVADFFCLLFSGKLFISLEVICKTIFDCCFLSFNTLNGLSVILVFHHQFLARDILGFGSIKYFDDCISDA